MLENYEEFTEEERALLSRYVTNCSGPIFCLRNLPEVIKGALFSRYSRSSLGLRTLLLKEFILSEETLLHEEKQKQVEESEAQFLAIKKAQNFYDRILDGYGDDSIGELGGAHVAFENISVLAAKIIEDSRIGGSPLEKSTRYIYFDQKFQGDYLFYKEPVLMTSAFRDLYLDTCRHLYETYSSLIPKLTQIIEKKCPPEANTSPVAYTAAIRAKVLDCLRGLLPASALTSMGCFGNGRFFESLLQRLHCHSLTEAQEIGRRTFNELSKVIPSFIRRADVSHRNYQAFSHFSDQMHAELSSLSSSCTKTLPSMRHPGVRLLSHDPESPIKVAAALLFPASQAGFMELTEYCRSLSEEQLGRILESAALFRENRRHKSPRALEHATFTFEMLTDFGIYRDLQRHRILTQERQVLTCNYGYYIPPEIKDTEMEGIYCAAMEEAKKGYDLIAKELPEEAQYIVPMGYHIHWYFHLNLRALQWICELRSIPAGHPGYRYVAQEMASQAIAACPAFERFFKFVDYEGHELGRLGQEIRIAEKMQARRGG